MADKQLVDWLKREDVKHHSYKTLHDFLVRHGRSSAEAKEAIKAARGSGRNWFLFWIVIGIAVMGLAVAALLVFMPGEESGLSQIFAQNMGGELFVQDCPPCENCASGFMKKVITDDGQKCMECLFDRDCVEGFECVSRKCV